jgi:acetyl/propionyl-CoA carboxylase alpha subunit/acetyl-CoA carboxylase carboxyltransferase component
MEPVTEMRRIAIVSRGDAAMRALNAIDELGGDGDRPTSVAVHTAADHASWPVREADASTMVPAYDDEAAVVAAAAAAGADTVWAGWSPLATSPSFAEACSAAGLIFVGPSARALRAAADPGAVRAAAERAGVGLAAEVLGDRRRAIEVDVLADSAGTVWVLPPRDTSLRRVGQTVAAESVTLPDAVASIVRSAAESITRTLGLTGVVAVSFAVADGDAPELLGVTPRLQPEHAVTEGLTGLDLVRLQLELADGGRLAGEPPVASGHAATVRLIAVDPERDFAPTPGTLVLLRPPTGPGVRVDLGVTEGDAIPADDPMLARVLVTSRDRTETLARMRAALLRSSFVVTGGTTSRSLVATMLGSPDIVAGRYDLGWLDRMAEAGTLLPPAHPVAVLGAAVAAYDEDHAAEVATFLATAARGRPDSVEHPGHSVSLRYLGTTYRLHTYRSGPDSYRVDVGDGLVDVVVEHLGDFERRLVVGDRTHRVMAVVDGAAMLISVDGTTHRLTRDDGRVVRAEFPAFVVSVLVRPGDPVEQNQPILVLESMKMETPVHAPCAGVIYDVLASANEQVEIGAPLLRIRPDSLTALTAPHGDGHVEFAPLLAAVPEPECACEPVFTVLQSYLLGYDLDPVSARHLVARQRRLAGELAVDDPRLLDVEERLLDLFADLASLSRPQPAADDQRSTQEYLLSFLQWLEVERSGIPASYQTRLLRALNRYGVKTLARTPRLEHAVVRMFWSQQRLGQLLPVMTTILERRLRHRAELAGMARPDLRALLDRVAAATQNRFEVVSELARDVRFHVIDEPVVEEVVRDVVRRAGGLLDELTICRDRGRREEIISALVASPQPIRGELLRRWRTEPTSARPGLLEVHLRRFYRSRHLRDVSTGEHAGRPLCWADYDIDERHVHVVAAYGSLDELAGVAAAVRSQLAPVPDAAQVVVDVVTWRSGSRPEIDDLAVELRGLLDTVDFGRRLHRLDLTVTSDEGSAPEHARVQHLTFRQSAAGGWTEELLYRNLHPMLAKRLEIWRLGNFELQRLLSPEDVYLFRGVAHENPKDVRLFALAEVRDLTPVRDEHGRVVGLPLLERMSVQALASMREALASMPPKERPSANRVILYVRPPWDVSRAATRDLARSMAPLTRGARLDKVVMRVRMPDDSAPLGLRDAVLHVSGIGRRGLNVRERPVGDEPVRPLTEYRQKVLRAERFGAPYPYEVVRMLTPPAGTPSDFPPGSFVEHDLDETGERLVPVDRPYGRNAANVVVGLITNVTEKVPEGMTRVAILSDPTRGLGNLAEPECRRIDAALDLAEQMHVPTEWFALSSGALIAMDSGTENMDWIAKTLRRLIEYTQAGNEVNIVVTGINVGGQPYWNAEATMLMHTKGILVMTPDSAMVLTGKQALDFSGGVSAEDNVGIGGYERIMGPNGQGQYWAPDLPGACDVLLRHYEHTYVVPGERFPRRRTTLDPIDRDVRTSPHTPVEGSEFTVVGDIFSAEKNAERKKPFDIRSVMRAVADADAEPLERWQRWRGAETSVVWDAHVGGLPVLMLGLESRTLARRGFVPADGPPVFTSGTLFPQSSRKTARAVNAASGNRPLVVLANLSGFDGSPESMRRWQLEYGAEIGRAVTNFRGPIVFVVISRYHGGAFVVFSKALNPQLEIAAVEGSFASVIGGAPAAAVVFARDVTQRTEQDQRVIALREQAAAASETAAAEGLRTKLVETLEAVRAEKLKEVADEFDHIHSIQRALAVGSVDRIISAAELRPYVVDALERLMADAPVHV